MPFLPEFEFLSITDRPGMSLSHLFAVRSPYVYTPAVHKTTQQQFASSDHQGMKHLHHSALSFDVLVFIHQDGPGPCGRRENVIRGSKSLNTVNRLKPPYSMIQKGELCAPQVPGLEMDPTTARRYFVLYSARRYVFGSLQGTCGPFKRPARSFQWGKTL